MFFAPLYSNDPLTQHELTSITAIVEYLAVKKGGQSKTTYDRLKVEFDVTDVMLIKRCDFDRAVKFLVDFDDMLVN